MNMCLISDDLFDLIDNFGITDMDILSFHDVNIHETYQI